MQSIYNGVGNKEAANVVAGTILTIIVDIVTQCVTVQ